MKNQQWQLGPETLIVSRNKKGGVHGGGEGKRKEAASKPRSGNKAAGKPSSIKKLEKQIYY